jgi:hypothetical protein
MKLLACVLAVGFAGTSSLFFESAKTMRESQGVEVQMANDGAFREGLFLGKLNHDAKQQMLPPVGRWSTAEDRASFMRGYRQGFSGKSSNQ